MAAASRNLPDLHHVPFELPLCKQSTTDLTPGLNDRSNVAYLASRLRPATEKVQRTLTMLDVYVMAQCDRRLTRAQLRASSWSRTGRVEFR
mmetsp:Transcript_38477/g.84554  ORF Transcript_38477/g.84554 Transcript_38477/m.84554 type:complete len:91 (-) Transcript_38477:236-508(-)|eukprot:6176840-Pleurochrysis_carterae.AAC.2